MQTTSPTLLARLRGGQDPSAWNRFADLYVPILFSWARRCGETEQDAADLVQEVFVGLMQTLPNFSYDRNRNFRGWMRTLLVNKLRDRIRRRKRLERALEQIAVGDALPDFAEQFWESEYRREIARQALRLMQAEFEPMPWQACWESVAMGRPVDEVARAHGITRNAVYVARCRVLRRLREELDGLIE